MSSRSHEQVIRLVLLPREMPFHRSRIHNLTYMVPIALIIVGGILIFFPELDNVFIDIFPDKTRRTAQDIINGMRKVHYSIFIFGVGMMMLVKNYMLQKHTIHLVTNMRVMQITDVMKIQVREIFLNEIKEVKVKQMMLDRLSKRGKIWIKGKEYEQFFEVPDVSEPTKFKKAIAMASERFGKIPYQKIHKDTKRNYRVIKDKKPPPKKKEE